MGGHPLEHGGGSGFGVETLRHLDNTRGRYHRLFGVRARDATIGHHVAFFYIGNPGADPTNNSGSLYSDNPR
jgi:hypothetical protein